MVQIKKGVALEKSLVVPPERWSRDSMTRPFKITAVSVLERVARGIPEAEWAQWRFLEMLKKDWLYGAAVSPDTELSPQQTIPHQSNASSSELSNHRLEIQDFYWENIQAAIDQLQKLEATLDGADPQELLRLKKNLTASDTMPFRLLDRDGNKLSGSVFRKTFGLHTSPSSEDDLQRKQGEQRRQENQQLETPLKRKSTDEPQQQNRQKWSKTTPVEK